MLRIERYLLRHLVVATLFIAVILSAVVWLTQSLRFVELVVEGGAPMRLFVQLAVLTLPTFLGVVLPVALFAGVLFTYNRLIMESELVVMRAAGLGPVQLGRPALVLALGVTALVYALNLYVTPLAHRELAALRQAVRQDFSTILLREGVFNEVGTGLTVFVRERGKEGELNQILIHDARGDAGPVTIIAERGALVSSAGVSRVVVYNGVRQQFDPRAKRLSELAFDRYAVDLNAIKAEYAPRWPEARERTMSELLFAERDPNDPVSGNRIVAEVNRRLSSPLLAVAYALVALAALLSGEFNRRGQGARILAAIVAVVAVQGAALGLASSVVKLPLLAPLLYLIAVVPAAVASWMVLRPPRRRDVVPAVGTS